MGEAAATAVEEGAKAEVVMAAEVVAEVEEGETEVAAAARAVEFCMRARHLEQHV